jgi:hypothetical protein
MLGAAFGESNKEHAEKAARSSISKPTLDDVAWPGAGIAAAGVHALHVKMAQMPENTCHERMDHFLHFPAA